MMFVEEIGASRQPTWYDQRSSSSAHRLTTSCANLSAWSSGMNSRAHKGALCALRDLRHWATMLKGEEGYASYCLALSDSHQHRPIATRQKGGAMR